MEHVNFIVMRQGDSTIALVAADVLPELADEQSFKKAFIEVITHWMLTTVDGRNAYKSTGKDFNIGDFPNYAAAPLYLMLLKKGFNNLHVELISADQSGEWMYDDRLFDEARMDSSK